ncbi:MAG: heme exporter protein CcmB [candidate division NC10 bacterium]|nr:heme exporter protein CcmB [candidate division NC10 bacterium]MBI4390584.1 heme exporter protein CcmB [candidate division NC10 bacterium]
MGRIWAVARKDLLTEGRSKETLNGLLFFAALVLLVFGFALGPDPARLSQAASGVLWVGFILTGMLGLTRAFQAERENECLEGLLLYPGDRGALYLGKLLGNMVFMLALEVAVFPCFAFFYNMALWDALPGLLLTAALGTVGFAAVGTLFAAMTMHLRAREVLFPLLLLPFVVPVLLAAVKATEAFLRGAGRTEAFPWLVLLALFDLVFVTVSLFAFEWVVEE